MIFQFISYKPYAHIRFTDDELRILGICSDQHYDYKCRAANSEDSLAGTGVIKLMTNYHKNTDRPYKLSWGEIDTLCKITEGVQYLRDKKDQKTGFGLHLLLRRTLRRLNASALENVTVGGEI